MTFLLLPLWNYPLNYWHTITHGQAQIVRGIQTVRYLFFKWSREENMNWHNCVVAKGTKIDKFFHSISCNFAWSNTRNFRVLQYQTTIPLLGFLSSQCDLLNITVCHFISVEKKSIYSLSRALHLRNTNKIKLAACENGHTFLAHYFLQRRQSSTELADNCWLLYSVVILMLRKNIRFHGKNTVFTKNTRFRISDRFVRLQENWCCTEEQVGVWWTLYIYLFVS